MLSKKEKEELLEDGQNLKRKKKFSQAKKQNLEKSRSVDDLIRFLMNFQKIFSPFVNSAKKTITRFNKL